MTEWEPGGELTRALALPIGGWAVMVAVGKINRDVHLDLVPVRFPVQVSATLIWRNREENAVFEGRAMRIGRTVFLYASRAKDPDVELGKMGFSFG
jgi:hypothetical protein